MNIEKEYVMTIEDITSFTEYFAETTISLTPHFSLLPFLRAKMPLFFIMFSMFFIDNSIVRWIWVMGTLHITF